MTSVPDWWVKPRRVSVVIDNNSWILPYGRRLVEIIRAAGDDASLCRSHDDIRSGAVALYLGCVRITPPEVLARNERNLVVHESDLPEGRGFSPLTWQILEGKNSIPVCLFEAEADGVDSGPVIYRESLSFEGHELIGEMRDALGELTISMAMRFLSEEYPPNGSEQEGDGSHYKRRRPADSKLDVDRTIRDLFPMLRVVDNEKYPAFFEIGGHRYTLKIEKAESDSRREQSSRALKW